MNNEELVGLGNAPAVAPLVFKTVAFPYKQMTLPTLRDVAKAINVQYFGTKKVIWDCICKSGSEFIVVNYGMSPSPTVI